MIFEKFKKTVINYKMLSGGETVVAGISGGGDSMVLLHLLSRFIRVYGGQLTAAHLNHGLRGDEADRDEAFARDVAGEMGIPFISEMVDIRKVSADKGINIQDAGRRERYKFFERVAGDVNGDRIALGHNGDDQAETVIMRIIRGSGIKGLGGIPPVRGKIIRPLIELTREEINGYASRKGTSYVDDSSNLERKYLRNRVRLDLIPSLKGYNPNICRELTSLAEIAREVSSHLEDEARLAFEKAKYASGRGRNHLCLSIPNLSSLPGAVRSRVIFIALEQVTGDPSGFFSAHINDIINLVIEGKSGSSIDLPKGVRVYVEYDQVIFSHGRPSEPPIFSYDLNPEGETYIPEIGIILESARIERLDDAGTCSSDSILIDLNKIVLPVKVRSFRPGDRIRLKGMEGRKKLKDFFIDEKIPRESRKRIALLSAGDDILWIVGWRQGSTAVPDEKTLKTLRVTVRKGRA